MVSSAFLLCLSGFWLGRAGGEAAPLVASDSHGSWVSGGEGGS